MMRLPNPVVPFVLAFALCAPTAACGHASSAPAGEDGGEESASDALSGAVTIGAELVTTANVNFRTGPGTSSSAMRVLPRGTTVVAVNRTTPVNKYYNVSSDGDEGWVHGAYLAPKTPASPPSPGPSSEGGAPVVVSAGRGFPTAGPWTSFYGPAQGVDLARVASTFRVINLDADPAGGNFTDADIATLRAGGQNRVISYLNVGSCENFRSYWSKCVASGALTTAYGGYPDEKWANLSNAAYQRLIVDDVAVALAARGVDGFFLDNMEVVEHGASTSNGPCDATCAQGGLDLVYKLRQKFPDKLIVMQNATGSFTRTGTTHGVPYASLLDGISHEEVYSNGGDPQARQEMLAWKSLGLTVNGRPFWLAVEDYAGACSAAKKSAATTLANQARADGLSSYVTDESAKQQKPCFWSDF